MKSEFNHTVFYNGEPLVKCRTAEEAAQFHSAIHAHDLEIEIAPPPPPMIADSGIPADLFERGQSEMFNVTKVMECPATLEEFERLTKDWTVVGKDKVGGKVMLTLKRRE